ncbi:DUF6188 family protein [Streptomyces sp. 147326]|uniref:DUF6188 family protein n=1 Tax=Streptomyces sp. 147326 TaxID=3074379 RepID=UPI00385756BA
MTCPPDASFEAWQITGPRGWRFVSLPGGDLAVWSPPEVHALPVERVSQPQQTER